MYPTNMSTITRALVSFCAFAISATAADWGPAQFLVGRWIGEGSGGPGQGTGSFSFTEELQGKTLVRRSFAEYPASPDKPASRHDDLTVIYRQDGQLKAMYFDSEEHTISYTVKAVENGVVFATDPAQSGPRFRLTYTNSGKDTVKIKFEVAPPGKEFTAYIDASARRAE